MLQKIIAFSIRQKLIVAIFTLVLVVCGVYSLTRLPIDAVPDITNNQVQVVTVSPSLAAQEIEQFITYPVEQAMATIPGIVDIRSVSRFGLSVLTVVFDDDVDQYLARQQVQERISIAREEIPEGMGAPEMMPMTTGLGEIYQYMIRPKKGFEDKYDATELRSIQDWIVRRQLLGTPGVADVSSFGGFLKQYEVAIDPDKLRSMNIGVNDVFDALHRNNENTGGAYIERQPAAYYIRAEGLVESIEDIENVVVKNNTGGAPVLIRDIATVQIGHAIRYGALTYNQHKEVVGAIVLMLKGENSSRVIASVKDKIEKISATLPEGLEIAPFLDRTKLVNNAIDTVTHNLLEGALIVIFVLVVLLGNVRAGIIVASVIPLSMLFAVCLMNLFGVSGNLMSLGAIDFGLIVDGAVIIVESTLFYLAENHAGQTLDKKEMDKVAGLSASRIMSAAAFGQIIILIVYLPLLALTGIEGKMFKPMAQTVVFAILGAFILSLTYVPMMSAWFLNRKIKAGHGISDKIIHGIRRAYDPMLHFVLRYRRAVLWTVLTLFALSLMLFTRLGGEFIPSLDEGDFAVEVRLRTGTSLTQTVKVTQQAADILLRDFPEVEQVVGKIGSSEIPTDPMPVEACDLMIILKHRDEWVTADNKDELAEKMRQQLAAIPGVDFGFQQPIQMRFNELMTGAKQDVVLKIYGEDLETLSEQAAKLSAIAGKVEGAKDIYVEKVTGLPQIMVRYNRAAIAKYGLSIADVNQTLRTAFAGEVAGRVYEGERKYDLALRFQQQNRQDITDVENVMISTKNGFQVPLTEVANVEVRLGPNQIQRDNARRRIIVAFNVRGRDVSSIVEELQQKIGKQMKLPPGYNITYGGAFENLEAAKSRLGIAVPLSLLMIFALLYFTFHSVKYGVLIFTAIPLSAIGGIIALWLRDMPFSVSAGVGFIALFGVAVLNGIVLITEFNRLKKEGMEDVYTRVLLGTAVRLRPVIMTATVASLGFLPMALSNGSGAEVQRPLATVVIGGLVSATMLTLLVLPVLYIYFEKGMKPPKFKPAATLILLLILGAALPAASQQRVSLQQAVDKALQQHPGVKARELAVKREEVLKGAVADFSKTELNAQIGQNNSIKQDQLFSISQTIPFPSTIGANNRYNKERIKGEQDALQLTKTALAYEVKKAYLQLQYLHAQQRLLFFQDSLYQQFVTIAALKVKTGESAKLESLTAETQRMESRNALQNLEAEKLVWYRQLAGLLQEKDKFVIADTTFTALNWQNSDDSLLNNPQMLWQQQQVKIAAAGLRAEKTKVLPDITLGYFNQSLIGYQNTDGVDQYYDGGRRFQGVQFGLSVPLWWKPYAARSKAAAIYQQAEVQRSVQLQTQLAVQWQQDYETLLKQQRQLSYYDKAALPQARLMIAQAQLAYREGEIGYMQFWQHLQQSVTIERNYLDALLQHNQAVLALRQLNGTIIN
ncbi:CusA/CzcA family heavy metal efflux RND transporter [uncultured Chitinophaga sp.]|uniref:CusA/CzcA family heavy metal efflux RND transporter n=1 Tax=uncultured Chitinophaga sp. TaxID=339340 RepID=UPI0025E7453F|nr:CusA/CzcA family heavy metal efflux RND transporter [uncultured Chitinophaga sp.]